MTYDVVIIGGGPAGLTSAIYAGRDRLKTILIESFTVPGQAVVTSDIENYPGLPGAVSGFDLIEKFKKQAKEFGAEFKTDDVKSIKECVENGKKAYIVKLLDGFVKAFSVIIASGARPKKLGIPGEEKFRGKGVSYCAVCDAAFFKNKNITVIGGGNTAVEEALFLTKFASSVTQIHRRERLRATKILQEKAFANKKIKFIWNSSLKEIAGGGKTERVVIKNTKTGKETTLATEGVFVFVGYAPNTEFIKDFLNFDKNGYIITDGEMKTSREGVFACGDVRKKSLRQVVTAAGDGATAAYSARLYIEELEGTSYK